MVHPPNPPPIILEPRTPSKFSPIFTRASNSEVVISYWVDIAQCPSFKMFPTSSASPFVNAFIIRRTRSFSSIIYFALLISIGLIVSEIFFKSSNVTSRSELTSDLESLTSLTMFSQEIRLLLYSESTARLCLILELTNTQL